MSKKNEHFSEENIQMTDVSIKRCSAVFSMVETQIKAIVSGRADSFVINNMHEERREPAPAHIPDPYSHTLKNK